jgi:hypothetical protein
VSAQVGALCNTSRWKLEAQLPAGPPMWLKPPDTTTCPQHGSLRCGVSLAPLTLSQTAAMGRHRVQQMSCALWRYTPSSLYCRAPYAWRGAGWARAKGVCDDIIAAAAGHTYGVTRAPQSRLPHNPQPSVAPHPT